MSLIQEIVTALEMADRVGIENPFHKRSDKALVIDIRYAIDTRKSANGGDYDYWRDFTVEDGKVIVTWHSSCELELQEDEPSVFEVSISVDTLYALAQDHWQWLMRQRKMMKRHQAKADLADE